MNKLSDQSELTVTATSWLDAQLIHAYFQNKYKNHENILVIPTTNPSSFEEFYMGTYAEISQDQRDILTDMIIPFHMEPSKHFALLHVKFIGDEKKPVIYWLDSMGDAMPAKVKNLVNEVFQQQNKVIHECAVGRQQTNGYDCGVYVALNANTLVNNTDAEDLIENNNAFKSMSRAQSVALRQEIVDIANEDRVDQYVYVGAHVDANVDKNLWDQNKFLNRISQDLVDFGATIQNNEDAFTTFDKAFDIAAAAYQKAAESQTKNRYAFFNEYNSLKAQFGQHHTKDPAKSCAAEAEPVLEEGKDFIRVSGSAI